MPLAQPFELPIDPALQHCTPPVACLCPSSHPAGPALELPATREPSLSALLAARLTQPSTSPPPVGPTSPPFLAARLTQALELPATREPNLPALPRRPTDSGPRPPVTREPNLSARLTHRLLASLPTAR
ncbi:hypothetical protein Axi01nite_84400 [Actinoplanes xinjiangensis]|nr:hypothetical protein Axi01nite_84400 [Actinoplanes xinjiangensis]